MKKKKRNIPIYVRGDVKLQTQVTVQVDNAGNEWLTPDQIDSLESMHFWARYELGNPLRASRLIVQTWQTPEPQTHVTGSSALSGNLVRSTPAFGAVVI